MFTYKLYWIVTTCSFLHFTQAAKLDLTSLKFLLNVLIMSLSKSDLEEILRFSIVLGREAGKLILEGSDAILHSTAGPVEEKKNSVDLVTKYDKAVEDLVKKRTKEAYPSFGLYVKDKKF